MPCAKKEIDQLIDRHCTKIMAYKDFYNFVFYISTFSFKKIYSPGQDHKTLNFYHFVFYLSTFPFATDYAFGRIFVFIVLLLKRQITSWKELVEITKIFIELCKHKITPLDTAIRLNEFEIVKYFIDVLPANVNTIITDAGCTPLHIAAYSGSEEICNFLLQSGANVNAINFHSYKPLHYAAMNNWIEASRLLLQNGADINAKTSNGCNVLHLAIEYEADEDMIKLVIAYGVDLEAKCDHLQAPLFDALHYLEKTNIFEVLIANGANVNVKCLDIGESLLHYAIAIGKYDFVKILAKSSHLMKVKNLNGKTPMEVLFSKKDMKTMKSMISC